MINSDSPTEFIMGSNIALIYTFLTPLWKINLLRIKTELQFSAEMINYDWPTEFIMGSIIVFIHTFLTPLWKIELFLLTAKSILI